MKIQLTIAAALLSGLLTSGTASAYCTNNAFQMGWDAANQACTDIAQGYLPMPTDRGYRRHMGAEPEQTCTWQQVVECKNAMAQYLRRFRTCSNLIRRNIRVTNASGRTIGRAQDVWRTYVNTTCNLP
ncbi:hypothetical protein [Polyangium spumosum]|uniref:DUF1311 domain-containing protein n=1 Tax=Polyangium spumosum TaxID=889282 RepID=A0A6N7Q0D8_9BACT|nr:hypothetical protein [Polyangium spumosum]MRG97713.1 hypothetical protein [Polyangium spumosum]